MGPPDQDGPTLPRRVRAALELAREPGLGVGTGPTASARPARRTVAIGDPQAPIEKFLRVLDRHDLLGEDGRLADGVSVLSAGDHFDYQDERADLGLVAEEGRLLLRWLAAHPPGQAILLAGNHDLSRVMELHRMTDAGFARARRLALELQEREAGTGAELQRLFRDEFPDIPTPSVAARDFSSFTERQRELVRTLLLGGRFRLAHAGWIVAGDGSRRALLLTHASVNGRDLRLLGLDGERAPAAIAGRLNSLLESAVRRVGQRWRRGESAPLDLGPIYLPGGRAAGLGSGVGLEGGGLLCQRPSDPEGDASRGAEEFLEPAPRRYDPRTLPLGLLQAAGHFGHRKCLAELERWASPSARSVACGGLRTLRTDGRRVVYDQGIHPVPAGEAGLYMIDAEMNRVPAEQYPVLELQGWLDC